MEQEVQANSCHRWPVASLSRAALVMAGGILGIISASAAELTPRDMVLLDRLTWGINASSAAHLQAVGAERWLAEQLHPAATASLPEAVRNADRGDG